MDKSALRKALWALKSGTGIVGFIFLFAKPINGLLTVAGDIDLLSTYLPGIGNFLASGWGTLGTVLVGALIIAYAVYRREKEPEEKPTASRKMEPARMIGIGLVIVLIGLAIASAGLIVLRTRPASPVAAATNQVAEKPDISWSFDSGSQTMFLGLNVTSQTATQVGQPVPTLAESMNALDVNQGYVLGFQATGTSNLETPIENVSGYVRSDVTNQELPINFVVDTEPVPPAQTYGIPPHAVFTITTVNVPVANPAVDGIPVAKFRNDFASFVFVFSYNGKTFTRHFSRQEVADQFDLFTNSLRPSATAIPRVAKRAVAN